MDKDPLQARFFTSYRLWKTGAVSDAAIACLFFLWGQARKNPGGRPARDFMAFHDETNSEKVKSFLRAHQYKKVRGKVLAALENWLDGVWGLELCETVPSPLEVLRLQTEGKRHVSMIVREEFLSSPLEHKANAFEFLIHDLEHAFMFFHEENLHRQQRAFFSRVLRSWQAGLWREFMVDPDFARGFHYMMSDMNTHPQHGCQYLQALLVDYFRKRRQLDSFQRLNDADHRRIEGLIAEAF